MAGVTTFTQEMAEKICNRLSLGESLRTICKDDDFPSMGAVFKWLVDNESFAKQYAYARQVQADAFFDDVIDIADDSHADKYIDENGIERVNNEVINRSRLKIDARKWMAGKLRPKVYGDKMTLGGDDENPIKHSLEVVFRMPNK